MATNYLSTDIKYLKYRLESAESSLNKAVEYIEKMKKDRFARDIFFIFMGISSGVVGTLLTIYG